MGNKIAFIGDVGKAGTASAVHIQNRALLAGKAGYACFAICSHAPEVARCRSTDALSYIYQRPFTGKWKIPGIIWNLDNFLGIWSYIRIRECLTALRPDAVILYETDSIILEGLLLHYCRRNGIRTVIETTEWRDSRDYASILTKLLIMEKSLQKRTLDIACGNVIAISSFLQDHYLQKHCHVIRIPPVFDMEHFPVCRNADAGRPNVIRLVFAGTLSKKDFIQPLCEALVGINSETVRITFDIVGTTEEQLLHQCGISDPAQYGITCHGRLSHEKTLAIVSSCDFSVLMRENLRYAKAGVSTKFCEAMCLGVPSICTRVGGTDQFVTNGVNGFLIEQNDVQSIKVILEKILSLSEADLHRIKCSARTTAENCFSADRYVGEFQEFMDNLV